jgi:hypothetical protein
MVVDPARYVNWSPKPFVNLFFGEFGWLANYRNG